MLVLLLGQNESVIHQVLQSRTDKRLTRAPPASPARAPWKLRSNMNRLPSKYCAWHGLPQLNNPNHPVNPWEVPAVVFACPRGNTANEKPSESIPWPHSRLGWRRASYRRSTRQSLHPSHSHLKGRAYIRLPCPQALQVISMTLGA